MNPNILAIKYGTGSPEELLGIIPNEELVQMIEDRLRLRLAAEFDDSQGETLRMPSGMFLGQSQQPNYFWKQYKSALTYPLKRVNWYWRRHSNTINKFTLRGSKVCQKQSCLKTL